jgi:hypothetical protein
MVAEKALPTNRPRDKQRTLSSDSLQSLYFCICTSDSLNVELSIIKLGRLAKYFIHINARVTLIPNI